MARFLDETGLKALWEKVKSYVASALSGYATTAALKEVQTTADGAQTAVGNMALSVDDGTLNWTDQEGVKTGYAIGGGGSLSEADANALEALKSRMAMFEIVKTADDAPEKASVVIDGTTYSLRYGKKYAIPCAKNATFFSTWDKQSVRWCDFSQFDTSGFTSFASMFACCKSMETLDVSGWDTSAVTSMGSMFNGCSGLQSLDVSGWDTSAVTSMSSMFHNCSGLQSLDVSGWDTSAVTNMSNMFYNCSGLTSLDVSGWDTSAVTNMSSMFYNCSGLTSLDVSGKVTSACTSLSFMFGSCSKLQTLDTSGWDTSNVTTMYLFAYNAGQLKSIDLSSWNVAKCTNFSRFLESKSLTTLIGTHTLAEVESGEVVALDGLCVDLSLSIATSLDRKSILAVIKGLADLTGGTAQTLTLGSTLKAKLTEDDIAIATAKNWVIA